MDYEKKYKEALERAKKAIKYPDKPCFARVDDIFPELKESEDERIREDILAFIKRQGQHIDKYKWHKWIAWLEKKKVLTLDEEKQGKEDVLWCINQAKKHAKDENEMGTCWFAEKWLEKQGEHKPTDKVEPKFKIEKEKWYVCIQTYVLRGKIVVIKGQAYQAEKDNVIKGEDECLFIDRHDGKASDYFRYWTFQDAKDGDVLATDDGNICVFDGTVEDGKYPFAYYGLTRCRFESYDRRLPFTHDNVHPATKEQHDLLFAKMKEAGYEWNTEKKDLKKIEQKPTRSEEDEEHVNSLLQRLEGLCRNEFATTRFAINEDEDWLKSLKDRYTWKPSDEQVNFLEQWLKNNQYKGDARYCYPIFESLYQDLKKLREKQ